MNRHEVIAALQKSPLFGQVDEAMLESLVTGCLVLSLKPGEMVFHPGQEADRFFVILAGRVNIYKLSPRGDQQILHIYGPGESFGEAAMWAKIRFPAHAQAQEDTTLLAVTRKVLADAISTNTELAMGMMAGLSAKLREFNALIEELSLKEVPARLAGILVRLAHEHGDVFELPQSKRHLAAQIGTVAETLSRAFKKLRSEGLINVKGSKVRVLDLEGLCERAESC